MFGERTKVLRNVCTTFVHPVETMPLSIAERKDRLPHGGVKEIAAKIGADSGYVSRMMAGEVFPKTDRTKKKLRRGFRAAAKLIGLPVDEVFNLDELARAEWPLAELPAGQSAD